MENNNMNTQEEIQKVEVREKPSTPPKIRKSKEEQLQLALEKKQALELKIQKYQKELQEKNQKNRNRGLILLGIVVEQNIKKNSAKIPTQSDIDWWLGQHVLLPDKDQEVYIEFVRSLINEKTTYENSSNKGTSILE